jgi:TPR repeat protein
MFKNLTVILAFLMTLSSPVVAQDFRKGYDAYSAGDYATALKEWKPLAEAGDEDAQFNLAIMYDNGEGVPQDYAEAVRWYRLAAEQGDVDAQYNLGIMYDCNGKGVPLDDKEAIKWYRLAAEQGYAKAQYNLGVMYIMAKAFLKTTKKL